jgi:hypothetical protein
MIIDALSAGRTLEQLLTDFPYLGPALTREGLREALEACNAGLERRSRADYETQCVYTIMRRGRRTSNGFSIPTRPSVGRS